MTLDNLGTLEGAKQHTTQAIEYRKADEPSEEPAAAAKAVEEGKAVERGL